MSRAKVQRARSSRGSAGPAALCLRLLGVLLGVLLGARVIGCQRQAAPPLPSAPVAPASARKITSRDELLSGPSAFGVVGDVRLDNGLVVAVITSVDRSAGFALSGGNLIDLAPLPEGEDLLNQATLYLNDQFPRQARYTALEIVSAGGGAKPALVRAKGVDTHDARVAIETDYELAPGARWLTLRSRFTSSSTAAIRSYDIGEAIQWGRAEHMAPGYGYALPGKRVSAPWVGATGPHTSYAWVPDGARPFDVINGSVWSDPIGVVAELEPRKTVTWVRHVVVGHGDTASMAAAIAKLRGERTGRITGTVRSDGKPAAEARVHVLDDASALAGVAGVDASGAFAIDLLPGRYSALPVAPGRERGTPAGPLAVVAGSVAPARFELGPRSVIAWKIEGDEPAVRVVLIGTGATKDPELGPSFDGAGAKNTLISKNGAGEVAVVPGTYRVLVTRGPELELIDRQVEVAPGARVEIGGKLARGMATPGFIAADLHQHAAPSFDSAVSLEDRAISNAAEGIEVLVSTDHNVITDYAPVLAALGLARRVATVVGTEATTHSVGHFNAFPLSARRGDPRGGMVDPEGWTPDRIIDFVRGLGMPELPVFVQVNHPRAGGDIGYFNLMKLDRATGVASDARTSFRFDGMEVVNFGFADETAEQLADWFALLEHGHRVTATGGSDSHTISGREVGWPRTLVCAEDDDPARLDLRAFAEALRAGCATVSGGPFLVIRSGAVKMGGLLAAKKKDFEIEAEVAVPSWISVDRIRWYVDGEVEREAPLSTATGGRARDKLKARCAQDCFVVAIADGARPLDPVVSAAQKRKPVPIAVTNPIYVDADGDGRWRKGP